MSKKAVIIWLAAFAVLIAAVVIVASQSITVCWEGLEVNDALLMEVCGITPEEYFSLDFKHEDCPQSEEAIYRVGGCDTDWGAVFLVTGGFAVVYLVISALAYGVWRLNQGKM